MTVFLLYIIKSTCCLTLFYLIYKAVLSRETFFSFNRKVLLLGMAVSLVLPLVRINIDSVEVAHRPFIEIERMLNNPESSLLYANQDLQGNAIVDNPKATPDVCKYLTGFYFIGFGIVFFLLCHSLVCLHLLIRKGMRIKRDNYTIIVLNQFVTPFNWWNYIVVSDSDYLSASTEVLAHELAHLRKRHSIDIAFTDLVILLHWFNPVSWLLKKELQGVHEYQADREVLKTGANPITYQLLLVEKAVGIKLLAVGNSLNRSKLKKRIYMMNKEKSRNRMKFSLFLFLPVAILLIYVFAKPNDLTDSERSFSSLYDITDFPISLSFQMADNEPVALLVTENDSYDSIREKIKGLKIKGKTLILTIRAQRTTPMGLIRDLKSVLSEEYTKDGMLVKALLQETIADTAHN